LNHLIQKVVVQFVNLNRLIAIVVIHGVDYPAVVNNNVIPVWFVWCLYQTNAMN